MNIVLTISDEEMEFYNVDTCSRDPGDDRQPLAIGSSTPEGGRTRRRSRPW